MDRPRASPPTADAKPTPLQGFSAAFLLVAATTGASLYLVDMIGAGPIGLLYILPILAAATYAGLWPAIAAAVVATLTYDYFFTAPYGTFRIDKPADIATVIVLLIVALVTSRLAGGLRRQARLAAAHAARNATIAGFARRLLASGSERDIAEIAVGELARLMACNAVLMTGAETVALIAGSPAGLRLAPSDYAAAAAALDSGEPTGRGVQRVHIADWQFHPVLSADAVTAAIGLARDDGAPPVPAGQQELLGSLLDQLALALERARSDSEARRLATLYERDKIRAALLCSIGEDVKPRLNAIAAAVSALRRASSVEKDTLSAIADQVMRLDRYIDNLVDASPGAARAPIDVGNISIDLFRRSIRRDGTEIHLTPKEFAVLAELAKHAGEVLTHAHLLRAAWGPAGQDQIDYLRVVVRALRQKLETDPAKPALLINEPGVGYRLRYDAPADRTGAGRGLAPGRGF